MRTICVATTTKGERCALDFGLCPEHGLCFHHDPCRAEERKQRNRRAGLATAAKLRIPGLGPGELPPLKSPHDASLWLEAIGRAVATNRLGAKEASAATKAVETWLKSHDAGKVADQVEELRQRIEAIRAPKVVP